MKAPIPGIQMHTDFQKFSYTRTDYPNSLFITTEPARTSTSETATNSITTQISLSLSLLPISSATIIGVASYNLGTKDIQVSPGQSYDIEMPLTWALSPSTVLSYSMVNYDTYPFPNFVTFNIVNGHITFTVPLTGYSPKYSFAFLVSVAAESNSVSNPVYLTVIEPTIWLIVHWAEWENQDQNKWKLCDRGYSLSNDNR